MMAHHVVLGRVGIKGSPEQLRKSVPLMSRLLTSLGEPANFPIELYLSEGELDRPERGKEIVSILHSTMKKLKQANYAPQEIAVHIPFRFREMPFNLATHEKGLWQNSVEMLRICLKLVADTEETTGIETVLVAHGYSLNEYKTTEQGLRYINYECDLLRICQALMEFPRDDRRKIGIETTAAGPCSSPRDLVALSRSTDCFIVQDVAHLLRRFDIDEANKTHEREYNDLARLVEAAKLMLPFTKHWHICQHDGGLAHYDGHLADPGILDWSRFVPLMVESFYQNQAIAIIEVRALNFAKPIESFASLLLIRSLIEEYLRKNTTSQR